MWLKVNYLKHNKIYLFKEYVKKYKFNSNLFNKLTI